MINNNIARSQKYLHVSQAVHAELEKYIENGNILHFEGCKVLYEFSSLEARKDFALKIEEVVKKSGVELDLTDNAINFLIKHFQLKISSNNLTKCILEYLCFSPVAMLPTALTFLVYKHLAHEYSQADATTIDYAGYYKKYVEAVNELIDNQLSDALMRSLTLNQLSDRSNINETLFKQFIQIHSTNVGEVVYAHTFLWLKPERIITDPIESESQVRAEFSKFYGEFVAYVLKTKQFQDCSDKMINLFNNGGGNGSIHNTMGSFLQYPLAIFLSSDDNAAMAQRLGEGLFGYIFAVFAPSLTIEDVALNYNAHFIPVMSLDEISKKLAVTYLAGILDWYRSLCFGVGHFNRVVAMECLEHHEQFVKTLYPKGFKLEVDIKPLELKVKVWQAYERGLDLSSKRSKKFKEKYGEQYLNKSY